MTKKLLILGAGCMQVPAIRTAKAMGLMVIVIDPLADAPGFIYADSMYVLDLADEKCLEVARYHNIDGVMTLAAEYPLPMVARICGDMGLPGTGIESVQKATNKHVMRRELEAAGIPVPEYRHAHTLDESIAACRDIEGSVVVKPCLSQGSSGITYLPAKAADNDISMAFERACLATRADGILVEAYVNGPEYSVEAVNYSGITHVLAVTDKLTSGIPYFVELGHSQPAGLSGRDYGAITELTVETMNALGIDNAASHTEIRLSGDGPCVIETAARMGGGYITTNLVPLSTGIDMVKAAIKLALGEEPGLDRRHLRGAAIRFLTAAPGIVDGVAGLQTALSMPGVREAEIWITEGDHVEALQGADARLGYVLCDGDCAQEAIDRAEKAMASIHITTHRQGVHI